MYKLTDKIYKDSIIVDSYYIEDNQAIHFNNILVVLKKFEKTKNPYGSWKRFGYLDNTKIEELNWNIKITEVLYGKSN